MEPNTHRLEALSQAVRVTLAIGGEPTEDTVKRAEAFEGFLSGE